LSAGGRTQRVGAGLLVAADGTSSIVVKKTRTHRAFKPDQLGQCVQYQMELDNNLIDRRIGDRNEMYYGHDVSPFGYAWIFPKDNQVTVGVGSLLSAVKVNLRNYLDYLVRKHPVASRKLSEAKILKFETALCPLSGVISPTYGNNLIVVGDAAGHCSPISGEGIYYSMVAGGIAGEVASQGIKDEDLSVGYLKRYEHQWRAKFGSDLRWGKWFEGIANRGRFMSRTFKKETPVKDSLSRKITDILGGIRPYRDTLVRALPEFLIGKIFQMIGGN
jgi:digeranylgeranylglycerophospholipid reductase